jgi:monofunctional biosynthetic peptidoglycan transglycosylase
MKKYVLYLLYIVSVTVLLIPLYMYFSHDVSDLREDYPHGIFLDGEMSFEIKKGVPKNWVKLQDISKYTRGAIVISEDWAFFQHEGIDINQIKIALSEVFSERKFRGASTITQQMVKNVFLSDERSLWRKIHEIILSQKVEKVLSKNRILEVYLNCIEFGPGVYGIRNASYHYFKKHPSALNPRESAFLAMLLPSPKRYYVSFKNKELTPFAKERVETTLKKMRMGRIITPEDYERYKFSKMSWEK